MIGCVGSTEPYNSYSSSGEGSTSNVKKIKIFNSGKTINIGSFCTYCIGDPRICYTGIKGEESIAYYPSLVIDDFSIYGNSYARCGIVNEFLMDKTYVSKNSYGRINISKYKLNSNIPYGIASDFYDNSKTPISVEKSEINADTTVAWSGVSSLINSINTGKTSKWGATKSTNCIDCKSEYGTYDLNDIYSSIVLFPDANGIFTYFSLAGTKATFNNAKLINKELFVSMLGFDESIWNLDNIDIENGQYPFIRW